MCFYVYYNNKYWMMCRFRIIYCCDRYHKWFKQWIACHFRNLRIMNLVAFVWPWRRFAFKLACNDRTQHTPRTALPTFQTIKCDACCWSLFHCGVTVCGPPALNQRAVKSPPHFHIFAPRQRRIMAIDQIYRLSCHILIFMRSWKPGIGLT